MTLHVTSSFISCARFELAWGHDPTYSDCSSKQCSHQNNKLLEYCTYTSKQTFTTHLQIIVSSAPVVILCALNTYKSFMIRNLMHIKQKCSS